jgi:transcriptional regulator with XRE-family HTH domain
MLTDADRSPRAKMIRLARLVKGYTQAEVAALTGISPGRIFLLEAGRTKAHPGEIEKLSAVLGRPEILEFADEAQPPRHTAKRAR